MSEGVLQLKTSSFAHLLTFLMQWNQKHRRRFTKIGLCGGEHSIKGARQCAYSCGSRPSAALAAGWRRRQRQAAALQCQQSLTRLSTTLAMISMAQKEKP